MCKSAQTRLAYQRTAGAVDVQIRRHGDSSVRNVGIRALIGWRAGVEDEAQRRARVLVLGPGPFSRSYLEISLEAHRR